MARRFGLVLLALTALAVSPTSAQQLQRLHVADIALSASTAHPVRGVPFSVVLTVRVRENVHLQNVFLPYIAGPQELGDIREERHVPGAAVYRETLSLVARAPGLLRIGPAYLDAVDAQDGKPKRFSSNVLELRVPGVQTAGYGWAQGFLPPLIVLLLLAVAAGVRTRRERARPAPAWAQVAAPPPIEPAESAASAESSDSALQSAVAQLRRDRDRAAALRVRSALRHLAGAPEGSTLGDVLQLAGAADERVRSLIVQVEHASFAGEKELPAAIDGVLRRHEDTR
ncbi:MAG TPA: hypothetical protein VFE17_07600 [Candidatus Baltobacteraceae bacterium]|nr:hypothetical protein [Candidatus Baltobacteraceae bacterium]